MQNVKATKIQLNQWVSDEAHNILKYATAEELAKINFKRTNADVGYTCVYSEMTGNINSDRAKELLRLCAVVAINHNDDAVKELKNGETFKRGRVGYSQSLSALEYYFLQTHFSRKNVRMPLFNFLTGKATDLYID